MRFKSVRPYTAAYADPIRGQAGAEIRCVREDAEFPGWVWCVGPEQREGWVHVEFLERISGSDKATLKEDYNAKELDVGRGQELTVIRQIPGWFLCSNAAGATGWVPSDLLDPVNKE